MQPEFNKPVTPLYLYTNICICILNASVNYVRNNGTNCSEGLIWPCKKNAITGRISVTCGTNKYKCNNTIASLSLTTGSTLITCSREIGEASKICICKCAFVNAAHYIIVYIIRNDLRQCIFPYTAPHRHDECNLCDNHMTRSHIIHYR